MKVFLSFFLLVFLFFLFYHSLSLPLLVFPVDFTLFRNVFEICTCIFIWEDSKHRSNFMNINGGRMPSSSILNQWRPDCTSVEPYRTIGVSVEQSIGNQTFNDTIQFHNGTPKTVPTPRKNLFFYFVIIVNNQMAPLFHYFNEENENEFHVWDGPIRLVVK